MSIFSRLFGRKESESRSETRRETTPQEYQTAKVTIDIPTDEVALRAFDESYSGTIEQFYANMSRQLIERHGPLVKVDYVSHFPKFEIWFFYEDGTTIYSGQRAGCYDINFLSLGYVGEGPRYAQAFLEAAGAQLTSEDIESIRPGTSIQLSGGRVRIVRKEDQFSEDESDHVKFVREVERIGATYRLYTSPDEQSAKYFLAKQDITVQSFFIVVKTPEGYLGKDRQMEFDASPLVTNLDLAW